MFADVVDLRDFYATRTGRVARRIVRRELRRAWPDLRGQRVLGLGYTTPFLAPFEDEAERVLSFMPAQQGVLGWPEVGANRTALVDESALPLTDFSVDRVVLAHSLESTENLREMLREVWRVLMGDGRVVVIVPNRRGLWSRFDSTPFGQGKPYSASQLAGVLREAMFMPIQTRRALFVPPTRSRTLLGAAPAFERLGQRWMPHFGGVLMLEAGKQLYAVNRPQRTAEPARSRVVVPMPRVTPPPAAARRHWHANDA
ncbi:Methyltransferase domain-containing protein [Limimonas halophila]|uniref:Methyltransferase domain-containing protein n=1 Tax=Limimonas halophila TaxID=1082479 RepID=A0A1G7TGT0_9PROT|nr:methyltransferase domain-containing protein [Limimonas halophila]SDG34455.1 Methyltransferase domain-containing protein [Limimonas halophila]